MNVLPYTQEAFDLFHNGAVTLAEVECNGMAVDVDYIRSAIKRTGRRVERMRASLESSHITKEWRKAFRSKTNLNSSDQLGKVLFDILKYPSPGGTRTGKHRTDEDALKTVDDPFVRQFLEMKKLDHAVGTNLKGILREVVDGKVHCFFNLHKARTYRSSSDNFNFQNVPVRDPDMAALIRRAFVARPGRQIVELDIQGAEVRVGACYHKDPVMIDYINDKSKDMHRDMAMEIYKLPESEITKPIRHSGKNQFVFPEFYGSWFGDCAPALWASAGGHLTSSGVLVRDHLAELGLTELGAAAFGEDPEEGTFMHHLQQVEKRFWKRRFAVYDKWKMRWYQKYREQGWFKTLTGFICQSYMGRNDAINYPVQGSAFHCLLWGLIELVREMRKQRMKSVVVGQIHDSIVGDIVPAELQDYLALAKEIMSKRLPRAWRWLIVPMEIEAEVAPVGGSWADKKGFEI